MIFSDIINASLKPSLLQRHLRTDYPEKKDRDPNYFMRCGKSAKKQRPDNTGKRYQQSVEMVAGS